MPPKLKAEHTWNLYFESDSGLKPFSGIKEWMWTTGEIGIEPINGGGEFTATGKIRLRSRKKKSRNSELWRWAYQAFCWGYRKRRRAIRRAEKARREALKRRFADGATANVG